MQIAQKTKKSKNETGKGMVVMIQNVIGRTSAKAAGFWKKRKELARQYKFMVKPCLLLAAIYTLAISALLRANYNYQDDLKRVFPEGRDGRIMAGIFLISYHRSSMRTVT